MVKLSKLILGHKFRVIFFLFLVSLLMAFFAYPPVFSYKIAKLLPEDHPVRVNFEDCISKFGKDNDHTMTISVQDSFFFHIDHLKKWDALSKNIEALGGVESVLSVTNVPILFRDDSLNTFITKKWYSSDYDKDSLDIAIQTYKNQSIYSDMLYKEESFSAIMLVVLDSEILESNKRNNLIEKINDLCRSYSSHFGNDIKYSGLPYIRTVHSIKVKKEVAKLILLTLLITFCVLFLFFRSFIPTVGSIITVIFGVLFSFGIIGLLQEMFGSKYEISPLMALVPPVIIIIGVPNCIFLINKYHLAYKELRVKEKALRLMITKIGHITLFTNLTTAFGFAAFIFTSSESLQSFGLVSSLGILSIFIISLFFIPIWMSFFPEPTEREIKHLDKMWVNYMITYFSHLVQNSRPLIYIITLIILIISIIGFFQIKTTGNITDDLPKHGKLYSDLQFFENNFGGVMPLDIIVNTNENKGIYDNNFMHKIDSLQIALSSFSYFSTSVSYIDLIKSTYQTYHNQQSNYFIVPPEIPKRPKRMIGSIAKEYQQNDTVRYYKYLYRFRNNYNSSNNMLTDSLYKSARISLRMKDIPTPKMDSLLIQIRPIIKSIFPGYILNPDTTNYNRVTRSYNFPNIIVTGTSRVFLEGTKFLVSNLMFSLSLVILLISIFMSWIFRSFRMVIISLVPNIIPLIFTASVMGFFSIPIKPSTILVFSIAFGISVDDTIHFLAKYRQELKNHNSNIRISILNALKETGLSMIYTSVVLFFGFFIFVVSEFGGTIALGLLVSITLLIAMLSNLLLLPSLLLSSEKFFKKQYN